MELLVVDERALQAALPGGGGCAGGVPAAVGGREPRAHARRVARHRRVRSHVRAHHVQRHHDGFVRVQVEEELAVILGKFL